MSGNTPPTKPAKLQDQLREACRVRHYSLATERSYVRWYKQFVRWAGMKHPATLSGDRVQAWLSHLATERDVAASTQRQALAALASNMQNLRRARNDARSDAGVSRVVASGCGRLRSLT